MTGGTPRGELGPIVGLGALEQTVRTVLMQPQILGVFLDEAARQTYGIETRVLRPQEIVCGPAPDALNHPALIVHVEDDVETHRHADRSYSAQLVVGVHCVITGGSPADCRRTADVHAAAVRSLLLQRLPGSSVGPATVAHVEWIGDAIADAPAETASTRAEMIVRLAVTVSGVASDRRGRIPDLDPNDPDTNGPAPGPGLLPVLTEFAVDPEGETTDWEVAEPDEETP